MREVPALAVWTPGGPHRGGQGSPASACERGRKQAGGPGFCARPPWGSPRSPRLHKCLRAPTRAEPQCRRRLCPLPGAASLPAHRAVTWGSAALRLPSWGVGWLTHLLRVPARPVAAGSQGAHHTESGLFEGRHGAVRRPCPRGCAGEETSVRSSRVPTGSLAGGPGCWGHALDLRPALPALGSAYPLPSLLRGPWAAWPRALATQKFLGSPEKLWTVRPGTCPPGLQETAGLRSRGRAGQRNSFPGRRRLELCGEQLSPLSTGRPEAGRQRSPCSELGLSQRRVCVWGGRTTQIDTQPFRGRADTPRQQAGKQIQSGKVTLACRGAQRLTLHLRLRKSASVQHLRLYPRHASVSSVKP